MQNKKKNKKYKNVPNGFTKRKPFYTGWSVYMLNISASPVANLNALAYSLFEANNATHTTNCELTYQTAIVRMKV